MAQMILFVQGFAKTECIASWLFWNKPFMPGSGTVSDGEPAAIRALSWPGSRDAFGPFVSLA
jgi:hypothetical protein